MNTLLITALKSILTSMLTEKVLLAVFIRLAEYIASNTKNEFDDKVVSDIKAAIKK